MLRSKSLVLRSLIRATNRRDRNHEGNGQADRQHRRRREAIGYALAAARPGDCLIIAGKGHETTQEFADTVVPFDDRQVVREILEARRGSMA